MPQKKVYSFESDDIIVDYEVKRCIHAENCVHGLPAVFDVKKRPWIQPEHATAEQVVKAVMDCPTGALKFRRKVDGSPEPAPEQNTSLIVPNGPLYVKGDVEIVATDKSSQPEHRMAICRCGASKNKPFCDNAHQKINFEADGQVKDNQAETRDMAIDGRLKLIGVSNGPLLLQGNFEIHSDDGASIFRGTKAALCRCGASQNKPFCDGAHRAINFSTE